jgi:hypothetical protein
LEYAVALLVLAALVALAVLGPLRSRDDGGEPGVEDRRATLEAARDAKYREIRDGELDFRTGKVSEADHRATDRDLRAQAIDILAELDALDTPPDPARAAEPTERGRSR